MFNLARLKDRCNKMVLSDTGCITKTEGLKLIEVIEILSAAHTKIDKFLCPYTPSKDAWDETDCHNVKVRIMIEEALELTAKKLGELG